MCVRMCVCVCVCVRVFSWELPVAARRGALLQLMLLAMLLVASRRLSAFGGAPCVSGEREVRDEVWPGTTIFLSIYLSICLALSG